MKYCCLYLLFFIFYSASGQSKLPVIRANSKVVSIRDGAFFDKDRWTLNKAEKPDVYVADRTRETTYVTFYTDIDSIRVEVKPGSRFDFVILYQGKDSCFTRIESAIQPKAEPQQSTKADTIPFTLTGYHAIAIKAIIDGKDIVMMHFDLSAFGFKLTKAAILQKTNLLPNRADVQAGKATANYRRLNKITTLQLGTRTWHNPDISATTLTAHDMDGRIGWDIFDGEVVELNYEKGIMVIHSHLPAQLTGYRRTKLKFIRSSPCVQGSVLVKGQKYTGYFAMDTGSDQSLIIDSAWAAKTHFPTSLEVIGLTVMHDPSGRSFASHTVVVPAISLAGFTSSKVPALLLGWQNPAGFSINFLGNALMSGYDLIADFQQDELYLRPNDVGGVR